MPSKTTINWLFNDKCGIYSLLVLIRKLHFFSTKVLSVYYILKLVLLWQILLAVRDNDVVQAVNRKTDVRYNF